jgi:hypothetical protein
MLPPPSLNINIYLDTSKNIEICGLYFSEKEISLKFIINFIV